MLLAEAPARSERLYAGKITLQERSLAQSVKAGSLDLAANS
jgi:hypothetical protein